MSKALLGSHVDPTTLRLLDEVRALRRRVQDLEAALEAAETARDERDDLRVEFAVEPSTAG
jgi:molybdenum-dependent DNA-binding transcriptional regulator ModE